MSASRTTDLEAGCDLLRSLHRPGDPLLLPNAWDVATARAVVAAGAMQRPQQVASGLEAGCPCRIDVFLGPLLAGAGPGTQGAPVGDALHRANAYFEAGADCEYPIVLSGT